MSLGLRALSPKVKGQKYSTSHYVSPLDALLVKVLIQMAALFAHKKKGLSGTKQLGVVMSKGITKSIGGLCCRHADSTVE